MVDLIVSGLGGNLDSYCLKDSYSDDNWRTGKIQLRCTQIGVNLHSKARYIDRGLSRNLPFGYAGLCETNFRGDLFYVSIVRDGIGSFELDVFNHGHEEGHALFVLGHMNDLYNEALRLGLKVPFFEKDAINSDLAVRRFLEGNGKFDFEFALRMKDLLFNETIANVGGLIALVKFSNDKELIQSVNSQIMKFKPLPDLE